MPAALQFCNFYPTVQKNVRLVSNAPKIKSIQANFEPNFKKIQILLITLQSAWSGKKPCRTTVTLITLCPQIVSH